MTRPSPPEPVGQLEPADVVLRFLQGVGAGSEAEFYLRLFRSRPPERFATIAVLADAIADDAGGVTFDLRLLRHLGLTPVVVFGLDGPAHVEPHVDRLVRDLDSADVRTVRMTAPADRDRIVVATAAGRIPLVVLGDPDGDRRHGQLAGMVGALESHKLIILRTGGGLRLGGEPLSIVNLSTQFADLRHSGRLTPDDERLLTEARRVVDAVPHRLLVSVASPLNLLHELFTVRGAGTLLRTGARITRHDGYTGVDIPRLATLLASSFGREPAPAFFERAPRHTYVADDYRGAALVTDTPLGSYLTKFAVTREAQGEGIGQDLWSRLTADHPALIWRARRDNPIRRWYERQCHGRFDAGQWTVYVRNLDPAQMGAAVAFATTEPVDFI